MQKGFLLFLLPWVFAAPAGAADAPKTLGATDYPVYLTKLPNPNNYSLFANSGWDGNWYVGYNTCWIKRLPQIPKNTYTRAFIGAKLGRMKLIVNAKSAWDKQPVPGQIFMSIASTSAWTKENEYLVTTTEDIPLEGDAESAVEGTGEAEWFWVEVPLTLVNLNGPNYLALWSPTPGLINVSSSPVLAAGWGGKEEDTWIVRDLNGAPPRTAGANPGTPISYFQPAMGLKLIPQSPPHPLKVEIAGWKNAAPDSPKPTVIVQAEGQSIERVWLEYAGKNHTWIKIGRPLWKAPYIFSLDQSKLPAGRLQLRVAASNIWEERTASPPFSIDVAIDKKKP